MIGLTSEEKDTTMRTSWLTDCGDVTIYAPTQEGAAGQRVGRLEQTRVYGTVVEVSHPEEHG